MKLKEKLAKREAAKASATEQSDGTAESTSNPGTQSPAEDTEQAANNEATGAQNGPEGVAMQGDRGEQAEQRGSIPESGKNDSNNIKEAARGMSPATEDRKESASGVEF